MKDLHPKRKVENVAVMKEVAMYQIQIGLMALRDEMRIGRLSDLDLEIMALRLDIAILRIEVL